MTERFTLLSELGRGGMGVVWKARDEESGQIVALKLLRETYAEDPDYVTRFERELELAKRIHSRNVVQVLGYGMRDKTPYLALEFVDGPSLRERLASYGAYSWAEARPLLAQIAQGLADAHAAGVVHRDLKPSNVLIGTDGVAKLADFGIAKGLDLTRMTGTSTLLGTPAYLPPEGPADERSDLYSLGVIAYEMLTGVVPFEGRTYQEVILRHVREAPNLEKLPIEARPVVGWLLAKDPAERPQRTAELLSVLWGGAPVPVPVTSQSTRLPGTPPKAAQTQPSGTIEGQIQLGQPAAPGLNSSPPQTVRRSSTTLAAGVAAVALVACIAAVTLAGGFLKGAAGASPSVPAVAAGASAEPTGAPATTPPPKPILPPTPRPGFSSTGSMTISRTNATATLLTSGQVLIAGGGAGSDANTAELYDPAEGNFTRTGSMTIVRTAHAASRLSNGQVLVEGGYSWKGSGTAFLANADLFDPATGKFTPTSSMRSPHTEGVTAALLDGRVLVAGGRNNIGGGQDVTHD
jgi:serine/threonine protein kinase